MDGIIKEGSLGSILFKSKIITLEDVQAAEDGPDALASYVVSLRAALDRLAT